MTILKKFSGNYVEIIDWLRIPPAFYAAQTQEEYINQLKLDLHRTAYFNFRGSIKEIMERALKTEGLPVLSYSQGSMDGGTFTEIMLSPFSQKGAKGQELAYAEETADKEHHWRDSIRLAYVDDNGRNCAISISYLRDDPDVKNGEAFVSLDQRKRLFSVVIIKDTLLAPKDREVTYITHPDLLALAYDKFLPPEEAKKLQSQTASYAEDLEDKEVPDEIAKLTNSKSLNALLTGIFNGDSISLEHFDQLSSRIKTDHNLDNRDFKKVQLQRLIDNARMSLPYDLELNRNLTLIERSSFDDIDFFKDSNFEEKLVEIFSLVNQRIERLENHASKAGLKLSNALVFTAASSKEEATSDEEEKKAYQREILVAQAKKVLYNLESYKEINVDEELDKLNAIAKQKAEKDAPEKISALKELIHNARKSPTENEELHKFLNSEEERSLTELTFYDDFDKNLKNIFIQINKHIKKAESALSNDDELKNKLTYDAIRLEQYAKNLEKGSKEYALIPWLNAKATELRSLRDSYSLLEKAEIYRDVEFGQLVSNFLKQGQELQDKLTFFSEQLKKLAKNPKLDNETEVYLRTALLEEAATLERVMKNPSEAEAYRDIKFTGLVSKTLDTAFKKQQDKISQDAKTNIKQQINSLDPNNASHEEDLHKRLKNVEPKAPEASSKRPEKHDQNFWERHRNNIRGGIGLILLTALITGLLASGILAPLGIALAVGTVLIAGGATAGGIALATTAKSAYEENKWANEEQAYYASEEGQKELEYKASLAKYNKAVEDIQKIEKKRDAALMALGPNFKETKPAIMSKIVDDKVVEDEVLVEARLPDEVSEALKIVTAPTNKIIKEVEEKIKSIPTGVPSNDVGLPKTTPKGVVTTTTSENNLTKANKVQ